MGEPVRIHKSGVDVTVYGPAQLERCLGDGWQKLSERAQLPSEIPHRKLLEQAGVTLWALGEIEDLTLIQGIGPKKAREIEEFIHGPAA